MVKQRDRQGQRWLEKEMVKDRYDWRQKCIEYRWLATENTKYRDVQQKRLQKTEIANDRYGPKQRFPMTDMVQNRDFQ